MAHCTLTLEEKSDGTVRRSLVRQVRRAAIRAVDTIHLWMERAHQRHELAKLDAHRLKDIGVSRDQVEREIAKPFWRG